MGRDSKVLPKGTVTYSVWVWSTVKSKQVTASVTANGFATFKPSFALCPVVRGTTCHVGSLPAFQALELLVTDYIGRKAHPGEQIGLTVVVQGMAQSPSGAQLSPAEAAVSTVLGQPSSSPTPPPVDTGGAGGVGGGFPTNFPGSGTTVSPGNISSLFPTVSPPSTSTPSAGHESKHKVTRAIATASSLPFDPRLIGGQLAGLAVLAAAITMVVARLSLRTPQTVSLPSQTVAAAPPQPEPAAPADTSAKPDPGIKTDSES